MSINFYPIKVSPRKAIWDVDYLVRKHAGLESIRPPTELCWRKTTKGKKVERPRAIVHCTCYFGFKDWSDYHEMRKVSDHFNLGIQQILGMERGIPYVLTGDDIACLRLLDEQGSERAKTRVHETLRIGDTCKVADTYKNGALADVVGVFKAIDGNDVDLEVLMFGAARIVSVPAWAVEPL